jgi:hypothetical protein
VGHCGLFLKEPWRWPEVWRMNREQIRNPHLIYPGQIVYLEDFNGSPRLRVGQPLKLSPRTYEEADAGTDRIDSAQGDRAFPDQADRGRGEFQPDSSAHRGYAGRSRLPECRRHRLRFRRDRE